MAQRPLSDAYLPGTRSHGIALRFSVQAPAERVHPALHRTAERRALNEELLDSLAGAYRKLAMWRYDYSDVRPHHPWDIGRLHECVMRSSRTKPSRLTSLLRRGGRRT